MSTQTLAPLDATYTVLLNEQQRQVIFAALKTYISALPGELHARDEFGNSAPNSLEDMFDLEGTAGPLSTTALNSFVL